MQVEKERIEEEIAQNDQKYSQGKPIGWKRLINGETLQANNYNNGGKPWSIDQSRPFLWETSEAAQLITER